MAGSKKAAPPSRSIVRQRIRFAEQYDALDRQCAGLTTHEAPLGDYGEAAPA